LDAGRCHVTEADAADRDIRVDWENAGFHDGRLTERGFTFDSGKMTPVSRSEFDRISDTHYVVHDFDAGGKATDTEDCNKV
jgi:hypothetical protein